MCSSWCTLATAMKNHWNESLTTLASPSSVQYKPALGGVGGSLRWRCLKKWHPNLGPIRYSYPSDLIMCKSFLRTSNGMPQDMCMCVFLGSGCISLTGLSEESTGWRVTDLEWQVWLWKERQSFKPSKNGSTHLWKKKEQLLTFIRSCVQHPSHSKPWILLRKDFDFPCGQ